MDRQIDAVDPRAHSQPSNQSLPGQMGKMFLQAPVDLPSPQNSEGHQKKK